MKFGDLDKLFVHLAKSKFRSKFKLRDRELQYLMDKGIATIEKYAYDFIEKRLAPAHLENDGKQTPTKNHPVFVAQHVTAICRRKCLEKWHKIKADKELSTQQVNYIVSIIMKWIRNEFDKGDV